MHSCILCFCSGPNAQPRRSGLPSRPPFAPPGSGTGPKARQIVASDTQSARATSPPESPASRTALKAISRRAATTFRLRRPRSSSVWPIPQRAQVSATNRAMTGLKSRVSSTVAARGSLPADGAPVGSADESPLGDPVPVAPASRPDSRTSMADALPSSRRARTRGTAREHQRWARDPPRGGCDVRRTPRQGGPRRPR